MLNFQKAYLEDLFLDRVPLHEALTAIGAENVEQEWDARLTWNRWQRELSAWGFITF